MNNPGFRGNQLTAEELKIVQECLDRGQEVRMRGTKVSSFVRVSGARKHNLKNVDVDIRREALVAFTGVFGSGIRNSSRSSPARLALTTVSAAQGRNGVCLERTWDGRGGRRVMGREGQR